MEKPIEAILDPDEFEFGLHYLPDLNRPAPRWIVEAWKRAAEIAQSKQESTATLNPDIIFEVEDE